MEEEEKRKNEFRTLFWSEKKRLLNRPWKIENFFLHLLLLPLFCLRSSPRTFFSFQYTVDKSRKSKKSHNLKNISLLWGTWRKEYVLEEDAISFSYYTRVVWTGFGKLPCFFFLPSGAIYASIHSRGTVELGEVGTGWEMAWLPTCQVCPT